MFAFKSFDPEVFLYCWGMFLLYRNNGTGNIQLEIHVELCSNVKIQNQLVREEIIYAILTTCD